MSGDALPPPFRLTAYDTIGSTNDEAKRLARSGAAEGLVVCARQQTAGRGRRGRAWFSPPGNLFASILLRPSCDAATAAQLGFVAALALADALAGLAPGIAVRCKWPNDVLANGGKVAGILIETETTAGEQPEFVVLGIGVNLVSAPADTPYRATSLMGEGGPEVASSAMLAALIRCLAEWLARWRATGFAPVREAWLARAAGLGEPIVVRLARATLDGRFVDIDAGGALVLGTPDGDRRITAGDIFMAA
jgi:BirA family transcriptional regulator, biotin operon repressor / biotin---[acetyl-CoA-carboxylase] ligase